MEDLVAFAFAGLFSLFLLILNFSFLLGIRVYQMNKKIERLEEQILDIMRSDQTITEDLKEILKEMGKEPSTPE